MRLVNVRVLLEELVQTLEPFECLAPDRADRLVELRCDLLLRYTSVVGKVNATKDGRARPWPPAGAPSCLLIAQRLDRNTGF